MIYNHPFFPHTGNFFSTNEICITNRLRMSLEDQFSGDIVVYDIFRVLARH